MRAYVLKAARPIAPFPERAADLPIGNEKLGDLQERLFRRFGLDRVVVDDPAQVQSEEPCLVTYDDVYFTRRVLKSFLERWRAAGLSGSVRAALPRESGFVRGFSALAGFALEGEHALVDLFGVARGERFSPELSARPLPIIYKEILLRHPVPAPTIGVAELEHPITSSVVLPVRHWLHLLQANRLAVQVRFVDEVLAHPLWAAAVLLRAMWPGRGRLLWRVMAHARRLGRGVDIHPTARVEASFLGDGVRVGPFALVRGSIIGEGTVIEEQTNVTQCVLGPRCFVSKQSLIYASAAFEGAHLGMKGMQLGLVGRRAGLTARATALDSYVGLPVRVRVGERYEAVDLPLLGACFGHDSFVGADVYVAPGREIPCGVRVFPLKERVLAQVPAGAAPGDYTAEGGRLTPIARDRS